jgi:hypothetical protein
MATTKTPPTARSNAKSAAKKPTHPAATTVLLVRHGETPTTG